MGALREEGVAPKISRNIFSGLAEIREIRENKCPRKNLAIRYSPEDCSKIGRYAAEHGLTKASRHFTVSESTARLLKKQYLSELNHVRKNGGEILEAVGYMHSSFVILTSYN